MPQKWISRNNQRFENPALPISPKYQYPISSPFHEFELRAAKTICTRNTNAKINHNTISQVRSATNPIPRQKSKPPTLSCICCCGWSSCSRSLLPARFACQRAIETTVTSQASARIQMKLEMMEGKSRSDIRIFNKDLNLIEYRG